MARGSKGLIVLCGATLALLTASGFDLSKADQTASVLGLGVALLGILITLSSDTSSKESSTTSSRNRGDEAESIVSQHAELTINHTLQNATYTNLDLKCVVTNDHDSIISVGADQEITVKDLAREIGAAKLADRPYCIAIHGQQGSGKSVALATIAKKVIQEDSQIPQKVLFCNLSNWKTGSTLTQWLSEQTAVDSGRISPTRLRSMIAERRILLILDGIDNLAEADLVQVVRELTFGGLTSGCFLFSIETSRLEALLRSESSAASILSARLLPLSVSQLVEFFGRQNSRVLRDGQLVSTWSPVVRLLAENSSASMALYRVLGLPLYAALAVDQFSGERQDPAELAECAENGSDAIKRELLSGLIYARFPDLLENSDNSTNERSAVHRWIQTVASLDLHQPSIVEAFSARFAPVGVPAVLVSLLAGSAALIGGESLGSSAVVGVAVAALVCLGGMLFNLTSQYVYDDVTPQLLLRSERRRVLSALPFMGLAGFGIGYGLARSSEAGLPIATQTVFVTIPIMTSFVFYSGGYSKILHSFTYSIVVSAVALVLAGQSALLSCVLIGLAAGFRAAFFLRTVGRASSASPMHVLVVFGAVIGLFSTAIAVGAYFFSQIFGYSIWWALLSGFLVLLVAGVVLEWFPHWASDLDELVLGSPIMVAAVLTVAGVVSNDVVAAGILAMAIAAISISWSLWMRFIFARIVALIRGRSPIRTIAFWEELVVRGVLNRHGGSYRFRVLAFRDLLAPDRTRSFTEEFDEKVRSGNLYESTSADWALVDGESERMASHSISREPTAFEASALAVLIHRVGTTDAVSQFDVVREYVKTTGDVDAAAALGIALVAECERFQEDDAIQSFRNMREAKQSEADMKAAANRAIAMGEEGVLWLRRALRDTSIENPIRPHVVVVLARYLYGYGRESEAISLLEPHVAAGDHQIGVLMSRMLWSMGHKEQAISLCRSQADGGHIDSILALADFAFWTESWVECATWCELAIENGCVQEYSRLGLCRDRSGDRRGAIESWRQGVDRGLGESMVRLAEAYMDRDDLGQARSLLRMAAELEVEGDDSVQYLAQALQARLNRF